MRLPLLILLFSCMIIMNIHSAEKPLPFHIVYNPTNTPTYNYSPHALYENNPIITCTATSLSYALAISLRDYMLPWIDKIKKSLTKNNYRLLKTIINDFLWKHKYFIVGNITFGSYITTTILLLSDYHFMNDHTRWSQWKHEYSFEELCSISQQQLTKELLIAINKLHCNEGNPTDLNHPLMIFMSDMNNEIYRIKRYIKIASLQRTLHLMKLFPTNETKIKKAEQLLTRAHFIKHLFLSWLAEYNINYK
jgi:hypothetical protein